MGVVMVRVGVGKRRVVVGERAGRVMVVVVVVWGDGGGGSHQSARGQRVRS